MDQTYDDRKKLVEDYTTDPDVTPTEALKHLLKWARMEYHLYQFRRYRNKYHDSIDDLNKDRSVLRFRKELKDL
jgi:hypothetical protein